MLPTFSLRLVSCKCLYLTIETFLSWSCRWDRKGPLRPNLNTVWLSYQDFVQSARWTLMLPLVYHPFFSISYVNLLQSSFRLVKRQKFVISPVCYMTSIINVSSTDMHSFEHEFPSLWGCVVGVSVGGWNSSPPPSYNIIPDLSPSPQATLSQTGSANITAVPRAFVPLNASECMCSSLEDLASKAGGTFIEPECRTNQECNGVTCEVDTFGRVFYLESIILPCTYAVDVVLRNSERQPLFMTIFNRSEVHVLDFGLFIAPRLYVEIVRHPYSMEVSVSSFLIIR